MPPLLQDSDKAVIGQRLEELAEPVDVMLFTEPQSGLFVPGRRACLSCADTEQLMTEVAELSDKVSLEIKDVKADPAAAEEWGVTHTPTISIQRGTDSGVRMLGLPGGYEFLSFLETLISAGSGDGFGLSAETLEKLEGVDQDIDVKVFSTPT